MFNEKGVFFKYVDYFKEGKTTIKDIENFENEYKIKLPEDYKEFLIKYNGLVLSIDYEINNKEYVLNNTHFDKIGGRDFRAFESLNFLEQNMLEYKYNEEIDEKREIIQMNIIPIALNMEGSGDLGIGVGEDNLGKIYTWPLDWDYEVKYVCNSFKELIEGYYIIEIDDECEIIGTEKIFTINEPLN